MEGGWFSKCDSRFNVEHIRIHKWQTIPGWKAGCFQNVALASAPRTFESIICQCFTNGGLVVFKMRLSLQRHAHSL
eukprot:8612952-Pyramimonas_sp.AAC.1